MENKHYTLSNIIIEHSLTLDILLHCYIKLYRTLIFIYNHTASPLITNKHMADLTLSSGYRKGFNNYRAVGLLCLTLCLVLHQIRIIHLASISNRRSERTKCSRTVLPVSHFLLAYTRVWLEGARASPCSKCLLLIFS